MSNKGTGRDCPVCSASAKETVCNIDLALFDNHPMNGGYDVVQCNTCGFIFADTAVTQDELDIYYKELSKYEDKAISTGGGFSANDKNRLIDTVKFISNYITDKNARIVDLGCANGGLLKELKNEGFTNLAGIDPSQACVDITRSEVGCECYQHSIFDIPDSLGKFDVILSTHVLEHLLNVRETIAVMDRLLRPDGYIYIECPNATYYKEVIHAPLQEFNAEHINHFTEIAFQNLMQPFGFQNVITADKVFKIASDQDYHAVYGIFQKAVSHNYALQFDEEIRGNIDEYITKSNVILSGIQKVLSSLPKDMPIALLGVGQFAFKLLRTEAFKNNKNIKLFDNGSATIGKKINGVTILPGSEISNVYKKEKFTVVISSLIHETPIKNGILNKFNEEGTVPPTVIGFSNLLN